MATTKFLVFYRQVNPHISNLEAAMILEKAYYPLLIGMLGKAYVPQAIIKNLDQSIDLMPLILAAHEQDPECGEYFSDHENCAEDTEETGHYTEWDIQEITEIKAARQQKLLDEQAEKLKPIIVLKHY